MDRPIVVSAGRSCLGSAPSAPSTFRWQLYWFCVLPVITLLLSCPRCPSQDRRKVIIDQDEAGPAGTDLHSTLLLIQSPQTEVLGITVVTGDEYPLVRTKEETELWEQQYGRVGYLGAWTPRMYHPADQVGELKEGNPKAKPVQEDAAHFLVRAVRQFPNQVTIYAGGHDDQLGLGHLHRS